MADSGRYRGHTSGPLHIQRAPLPDNVGGYDYAILNEENEIVGEAYEIPGRSKRLPAAQNAALWANASKLLVERDALLAACKRAKKLLEPEVVKEPDRTIFWELVAAIELAEKEEAHEHASH